MRKFIKIFTILAFFGLFSVANAQTTADCVKKGYVMTDASCKAEGLVGVKCPYDKTKVFCAGAEAPKTCETEGYLSSPNDESCDTIVVNSKTCYANCKPCSPAFIPKKYYKTVYSVPVYTKIDATKGTYKRCKTNAEYTKCNVISPRYSHTVPYVSKKGFWHCNSKSFYGGKLRCEDITDCEMCSGGESVGGGLSKPIVCTHNLGCYSACGSITGNVTDKGVALTEEAKKCVEACFADEPFLGGTLLELGGLLEALGKGK